MSGTYEDLEVWQAAVELTVQIYHLTENFPRHETYGLTSQMRRAAVSVASNIAEGKGRASDRELAQFLRLSRGSVFELETQLAICRRLGYGTEGDCAATKKDLARVGQMLNGLIRSVRAA